MSRPNVNSTVYGWELNALVNKDLGSPLLGSYGMKSWLITRGNNVSTPGAHRYSCLPPHISCSFTIRQALTASSANGVHAKVKCVTSRPKLGRASVHHSAFSHTEISNYLHGAAWYSMIQSPGASGSLWGKSPRGAPTRWKASLSYKVNNLRPEEVLAKSEVKLRLVEQRQMPTAASKPAPNVGIASYCFLCFLSSAICSTFLV